MNNTARTLLKKRMMDNRDYRSRDYTSNDRAEHNIHDMYDRRDRRDYNDYRRDYNDYNDYKRRTDYDDYAHHENLYSLSKEDIHEWSKNLDNKDGSRGPKFNLSQMTSIAERLGIRFEHYNEHEFCMTANMLYSDLCMDLKNVVTPDKEAIEYGKMARSWLEDSDTSAKGSEKLALYYYLIVKK